VLRSQGLPEDHSTTEGLARPLRGKSIRAYTAADIAALVYDFALESLTSAERQFDFWFTPSTRRCHHHVDWRQLDLLAERNRGLARAARSHSRPLIVGDPR
jgi:hypothetical protein